MNKFELAKQYIEMYDSLAKSIQTAGGDFSLFDLKKYDSSRIDLCTCTKWS